MYRYQSFCQNSNPCHNQPSRYLFSFIKRDGVTGTGIAGALFELIDQCGNSQTTQSDLSGNVSFSILSGQCYQLVELAPPINYLPYTRIHTITIDAGGCLLIDGIHQPCFTIYNQPISSGTSFNAIKLNSATNTPLAGAEFTLYQSGTIVATTVTNTSGTFSFSNLYTGRYDLYETVTPPGFMPIINSFIVDVASDGSVLIDGIAANGFPFYNIPSSTSGLIFTKTSAVTGLPLAGATFSLSLNGTVMHTATSNASGIVNFGLQAAGTYTLVETNAPTGYVPNTTVYTVQISANGDITINGTPISAFAVANTPLSALQIQKIDSTSSTPLAGATFTLSQNSIPLFTATTNANGLAAFASLTAGAYLLQETTPPLGYLPNATQYPVVVNASGGILINGLPLINNTFTVPNTRIIP